jgi:putative endonuclease
MNTELRGRWGEAEAAEYLRRMGYSIVGMNYRCRMGEIDVIAENRKYLVFCEVKLRRSPDFAQAREYVTAAKQARLRTAAALWLSQNETEKQPRFDVVEIYAPDDKNFSINHIENAFE